MLILSNETNKSNFDNQQKVLNDNTSLILGADDELLADKWICAINYFSSLHAD